MSHTISKKELKKADHLTALGRNTFEQLVRNQKMVFTVALVLLLSGAGYVAWDKVSSKKETAVQEQFYSIEKNYLKLKESFDKAEADQKDKSKKDSDKTKQTADKDSKKDGDDSKLPTGDLMKDYGSVVEAWNKLIDSYPSSKAAGMASLELSQLYLKYQSPKEALQVLSKVKAQQNSDQFMGAMVFHAYAKLLSNQGQCQEAIGVWENLEKKKHASFLVEPAKMGRALCLESLGQSEKAEMVLKELVADNNNSTSPGRGAPPATKGKSAIQKTAEKYLRFMKLKKSATGAAAS